MKKKSLLAMMLAFALILSACGGASTGESGDGKGEKVSLTVQAEEAWVPHYQKAVERVMEKYPDAEIEVKTIASFDHLDTIDATDTSNKDVTDVFAIPADRIYSMANKEALAGIDSKAMAEAIGGWDDFDAGLGGNLKVDGEYLAFPMNIETLINFVNTANAEKEGIDLSKPVELKDIKSPNTALIPVFDAWYGVALTNAAGIELLGQDDQGALFSDLTKEWSELNPEKQAAIEAIFDYWKMHMEANTSLFDKDAGFGYSDDQFTSGQEGVIRLGGPWDTSVNSEKTNGGADMDIYPISHLTVAGKPLRHWQGGWGLAINSRLEGNEKAMEVAQELIKEIVNPEYAVDFFKTTGKILENVSVDTYAQSDLPEVDKKVITSVIESYQAAPARPLFMEWGKVWDTWQNAILSWNSVTPATVEDAYKEVKASFDSMMDNM